MATTYSKITYDGKKVQVDSAIRDGNGKQIDTNYQEKLVSGTNIKTVNGNSLLGNGDIVISGGGSNKYLFTHFGDGNAFTLPLSDLEANKVYRMVVTQDNSGDRYYWDVIFKVITSGSSPTIEVLSFSNTYLFTASSVSLFTLEVGAIDSAILSYNATLNQGTISIKFINVTYVTHNSNNQLTSGQLVKEELIYYMTKIRCNIVINEL